MPKQTTIANRYVHINQVPDGLVPTLIDDYFFPEITNYIVDSIEANDRTLLIGPCGCGKSSLVEQIAARTKHDLIRVNANQQMTVSDFLGQWLIKDGKTYWQDGFLPIAMKRGYWLLIDELDFAEPSILSVLHPVLEENGKLFLKEKDNEVITPHKDFRVFATANSIGSTDDKLLYQGTNIMNEAFLDRWIVYKIEQLSKDIECTIVSSRTDVDRETATLMVQVASEVRHGMEKQTVKTTFSTRKLISWGQKVKLYKDPHLAAKYTILSKLTATDAETVTGIIQRVIGSERTSDGSGKVVNVDF